MPESVEESPKRKLEAALANYVRETQGESWVYTEYVFVGVCKNLENMDEYKYAVEFRGLPHSIVGMSSVIEGTANELLEEEDIDGHL